MITDLYFVDCENVGAHSLGLDDLGTVKIFYFTSNGVDFNCKKNEVNIVVNHTGCKDALDFVIDSYVGYQIRNFGHRVKYHIFSYDKGYNNIVEFWGSQGYAIELCGWEDIKIVDVHINLDSYANLGHKERRKIYNVYSNWHRSSSRSMSNLSSQINRLNLGGQLTKKDKQRLINLLFVNNSAVVTEVEKWR